MNPVPTLATAGWLATGLADTARFQAALADPRRAQDRVREEILQACARTAFGAAHGLPEGFESLAPGDYDTRSSWIDRAANGEPGILTRQPITRFEPSSGSTRASKLLPSTPLFRQQFSRAIHPWVVDLYRRHPKLIAGPAYWSISPVIRRPPTAGGIPVGFEEDSAYLGRLGKLLVDRALAVPGRIRHIGDIEEFRYATALLLLAQPELRLISVWSPSFLTALMAAIDRWGDRLLADLARGTHCCGRWIHAPRRARQIDLRQPWPRLGLISCWTDALAARQLPALQERFAGIPLQPKGLLATEGMISIPYQGTHPLAITSHLLEFETDEGRLLGVHQLTEGTEATVVLSTGAGLLRYRLGDRIVVTGFLKRTPTIRFLGRTDRVSDRCGEKLTEAFIGSVLTALGVEGFAMLAPDGPGYTLYASAPPQAGALQARLEENVHYQWCIQLEQLTRVRTFQIQGDPEAQWLEAQRQRGQRLGDIKPAALDTEEGWSEIFTGRYR